MSKLVAPHGSDRLQPLLLPEAERAAERQRAEALPRVPLSSREARPPLGSLALRPGDSLTIL